MKTLILILLLLFQWQPDKYQTIGQLSATDPEGDEVSWVITAGNTGKFFIIGNCSGIVRVDTMAYHSFTYQRTWNITFTASDPQNNTTKITKKITLKKNKTYTVQ